MTETELAQAILDYIRSWYNAEYNGLLLVEKLNPGYKFILGVPHYMFPTTICCDYETDEEFLNFIYLELRTRNYMREDRYKVVRLSETREE